MAASKLLTVRGAREKIEVCGRNAEKNMCKLRRKRPRFEHFCGFWPPPLRVSAPPSLICAGLVVDICRSLVPPPINGGRGGESRKKRQNLRYFRVLESHSLTNRWVLRTPPKQREKDCRDRRRREQRNLRAFYLSFTQWSFFCTTELGK